MRWNKKAVAYKQERQVNKTKYVRHFAWLPTEVGKHIVWLEYYEVTYELLRIENGYTHWGEASRETLF